MNVSFGDKVYLVFGDFEWRRSEEYFHNGKRFHTYHLKGIDRTYFKTEVVAVANNGALLTRAGLTEIIDGKHFLPMSVSSEHNYLVHIEVISAEERFQAEEELDELMGNNWE